MTLVHPSFRGRWDLSSSGASAGSGARRLDCSAGIRGVGPGEEEVAAMYFVRLVDLAVTVSLRW